MVLNDEFIETLGHAAALWDRCTWIILDAHEIQSSKSSLQEAFYGLPRMQLTTCYALDHKGVWIERKQRQSYFLKHTRKKEMGKGHGTLGFVGKVWDAKWLKKKKMPYSETFQKKRNIWESYTCCKWWRRALIRNRVVKRGVRSTSFQPEGENYTERRD